MRELQIGCEIGRKAKILQVENKDLLFVYKRKTNATILSILVKLQKNNSLQRSLKINVN